MELDITGISKAQAERRTLLTESLHYRLRASEDKGLKQYYRYMREAILSHDPVLDVQLQVELLQFLERANQPLGDATQRTINGVMTLRPITRAFVTGRYEEAVNLAQATLDALPDLHGADRVLAASLMTWGSQAAIYLSKYEQAFRQLRKAIRVLEDEVVEKSGSDFAKWRTESLLGLAYRFLGYFYRIQGRVSEAIEAYKNAVRIWRKLDFNVELATTLNDLGFAIALTGKEGAGLRLVKEGLGIRQELTHRIPIALGLNTLGIISRRRGAYDASIERSKRALILGRAIGSKRIEGMALVALAEAKRRLALSDQTPNMGDKTLLLQEALGEARNALAQFKRTGEQSRQAEAGIEIGCALRDRIRTNSLKDEEKENIVKDSRNAFNEASKIAEGIATLHADALTNLAWLEFLARSPDESISNAISTAEGSIGYKYRALTRGQRAEEAFFVPMYVHLAKLGALRGHWAMQRALEDTGSDEKYVEDLLKKAIGSFIDSFRYNLRVSEHGHDFERLQDEIYERLSQLDGEALHMISQYVRSLGDRPGAQAMREFLEASALWYD